MKKTGILVLAVLILLIGGLIISCDSSVSEKLLSSNKTLVSISITTPTSLFCWSDEDLDISSIVVKGTYDDGSSANITGWTASEETNCLTISYTEGGVTKTTTIDVEVQDKNDWIMIPSDDGNNCWYYTYLSLSNTTVTEVEFVKQTPQSFELKKVIGTDYTISCNLTSNTNGNIKGYCNSNGSKIWIVGEHFVANPNCASMFEGFYSLTTITNVNLLNTSMVESMGSMFCGCNKLTALDISGWDTSSVTDMSYMFSDCNNLSTLDLSNWNTSKVTNMYRMFSACGKLTTLDLSSFDTSSIGSDSSGTMDYMFFDCSLLQHIYVDMTGIPVKWDTSKYGTDMFSNCGVSSVEQKTI